MNRLCALKWQQTKRRKKMNKIAEYTVRHVTNYQGKTQNFNNCSKYDENSAPAETQTFYL
jgi:hypothetical protein